MTRFFITLRAFFGTWHPSAYSLKVAPVVTDTTATSAVSTEAGAPTSAAVLTIILLPDHPTASAEGIVPAGLPED
jgi:hypothetical protein